MALAGREAGAAERHALVERHVLADLRGLAHHDAHAVVDEQPVADLRRRWISIPVSVRARRGDRARHHRDAGVVERVGDPVAEDRMDAGPCGEDLQRRNTAGTAVTVTAPTIRFQQAFGDWATLAHLGALMLARVDGKSPAEYLQPDLRPRVRAFARDLILRPPCEHRRGIRPPMKIQAVRALEVLDSRGNPTVSAAVELDDGTVAEASVPSGASTGTHEAVELRDGDPRRYGGRGVRAAVANVTDVLAPALRGMDPCDQAAVDRRMIDLDGTPAKSRLGANAILAVSCAVARASASARRLPLWRYLAAHRRPVLPVPMVNILSGGAHAGRNIEFQDFLVIPRGFGTYPEALQAIVAVHRAARELLDARGFVLTGVADEGGWGPLLPSNESALEILCRAIERAGLAIGGQMAIAIDVASTQFFRDGRYHLESRELTSGEMVDLLASWVARYPIVSIEDALAEDDWDGWRHLTSVLGSRVQLLGDDLFVTSLARLDRGIRTGAANAVLVKMNQVGTLTETFSVIDRACEAGYRAVISARSGETEDSFLADLAVASGAGQIKIGSVRTSERLAKYNRLLHIALALA